ncbi:hypothetical protein SAMN05660206_102301 [Sphingobacterium wenxiniae]|uniref:Uncharacterized protein n=1 Tax=Sphingobacterium wenxiniae TaxID=683125 RepID=A0A1I6QEC4_9SPHI|nr:hypothetical protein SAMN05660206_102301 [Sphingobacterium wenxiniae]
MPAKKLAGIKNQIYDEKILIDTMHHFLKFSAKQ